MARSSLPGKTDTVKQFSIGSAPSPARSYSSSELVFIGPGLFLVNLHQGWNAGIISSSSCLNLHAINNSLCLFAKQMRRLSSHAYAQRVVSWTYWNYTDFNPRFACHFAMLQSEIMSTCCTLLCIVQSRIWTSLCICLVLYIYIYI